MNKRICIFGILLSIVGVLLFLTYVNTLSVLWLFSLVLIIVGLVVVVLGVLLGEHKGSGGGRLPVPAGE